MNCACEEVNGRVVSVCAAHAVLLRAREESAKGGSWSTFPCGAGQAGRITLETGAGFQIEIGALYEIRRKTR